MSNVPFLGAGTEPDPRPGRKYCDRDNVDCDFALSLLRDVVNTPSSFSADRVGLLGGMSVEDALRYRCLVSRA